MKSMTDSTDKKEKKKSIKILRKSVLIPLTLVSLSVWVFVKFFFDPILAKTIKDTSEAIYGSTVDVENLSTSFGSGFLTIKRLGFSNQKDLTLNKIEFHNIKFQINIAEFLKKKIIIDDINAGKIFFDQKRKNKASVVSAEKKENNTFIIVNEKIKEGTTDFISFTKNKNDISFLGIEKKSKEIEQQINELKNYNLNYLKKDIKSINLEYEKIKKEKNPIKKIKAAGRFSKRVSKISKRIKSDKNKINKKYAQIKKNIRSIKSETKKNLNNTSNLFDEEKLASLVQAFTKNKINSVISPWMNQINDYKKYLPKKSAKKSENKKEEIISKKGKTIPFHMDSDLPSFLVKKIQIEAQDKHSNFNMKLKNLTNQYNKFIKKSTGTFEFKDRLSGKITGRLSLDKAKFDLEVSSNNNKVKNIKLLSHKKLTVKVEKAIESWDLKYQKVPNNTEVFYSHNYQDTLLTIDNQSSNRFINETLNKAASKIQSIQSSFGYNEKSKNKFIFRSSLGDSLTRQIQYSLNQSLEKIKREAEIKIKSKLNEKRKQLEQKLNIEKKDLLKKLGVKLPKIKI